MSLEERFKSAVRRAYEAAGVRLQEHHAASLASVYANWAEGADDGVVARVERALAASLGVRA
ncbi:hypothetical protein [Phenylobacterium sp.]|uniref:hypothetical protein n=1 Tax=Phenylobacterium sp. TaxID=1871053 RepID=UPI002731D79D|nr:hypothetical protein [Phenylobacterium sp.]MDP1619289.1 hypothetical protein [Phenylobacterium sp.]MDP1987756.1 hypothetical protein [Phenylobacterium sp.]